MGMGGKTHDPPIRYRTPPRYHAPRVLADIACAASEAIDRYLRSRPIGCAAHSEPRLMQGNVAKDQQHFGGPTTRQKSPKKISARRRRKIGDPSCRKKFPRRRQGRRNAFPQKKWRRQNSRSVQRSGGGGGGVQEDSFAY